MSGIRDFSTLVHPELSAGRYIPELHVPGPAFLLPIVGWIFRLLKGEPTVSDTVRTKVEQIATTDGSAIIPTYVARPEGSSGKKIPAILWIHGGGMVLGSYTQDVAKLISLVTPNPDIYPEGCVVVAPDYRLAPAHPAPTLGDDCVAAWRWMLDHAEELGIDTDRLVIGGVSAGGGLAALLCQQLLDEARKTSATGASSPMPKLQWLIYPMLDDRTVPRIQDERDTGNYQSKYVVWSHQSNIYGWTSYLGGRPPGSDLPPALEAQVPGRREDLTGLPPTWIGVGSLDLFHQEDVEYAERLQQAGVQVTLKVVQGGFHGFDGLFPKTEVSKAFWASQIEFLKTV